MKTPTDEIERLNWAASEHLVSRCRWLFTAFSLVLVSHAIWSWKTIGVVSSAFFVVALVLATAFFWSKWRFRLYVVASSYIALALWSLRMFAETHGKVHFWFVIACFGGVYGYTLWKIARVAAIVYGPGWGRERSQASTLWQMLMGIPRNDAVIEFSWFLYTFRLLKCEKFWAVVVAAKFGRLFTPLGFGVRKLEEVKFSRLPDGATEVRLGKRTFRATNMTPPNPVVP